jgi:hypothetical protein
VPPDDVVELLLRRLRVAVAESQRLVAWSKMLLFGSDLLKDPARMLRRCAWCGRLNLDEQWVPADEAPAFVWTMLDQRATHGICRNCLDDLELERQERQAATSHASDQ